MVYQLENSFKILMYVYQPENSPTRGKLSPGLFPQARSRVSRVAPLGITPTPLSYTAHRQSKMSFHVKATESTKSGTVQHHYFKHGFLKITYILNTVEFPCPIPLYVLSPYKFEDPTQILQPGDHCSVTTKKV